MSSIFLYSVKKKSKLFFSYSDILSRWLVTDQCKEDFMEQKNTLWIIAAVGAFLLVVLGGAALMFSKSRTPAPIMASVAPVEKKNTDTGWINPPQTSSTSSPIDYIHSQVSTDELTVYSDNTTINTPNINSSEPAATTIDLNALKNSLISDQTTPAQNINITVNVPEQTKTVETKVTSTGVTTKTLETPASVVTAASPAATSASSTAKSTTVSSSKATTTKVKPAAEEKKVTQYWVQVAAYSNKKAAETARTALDSNKIQSDIFTYKDNKDKLFYRVRVGPYTTKSEAEYWKSRILKISEFEKSESYVTSTMN